ncbi:MAG: hypothetical protein ACREBE_07420 [bacterium]
MFLTHTQIRAALNAIEDAERTFDCDVARADVDGNETFGPGKVLYGTHGGAFLQVDPETGEVRCGACEGGMDATARKKVEQERCGRDGKVRYHLVTDPGPTL